MNNFYYVVRLDCDSNAVTLETPQEVFELLKKKKLVTIARYSDQKTGSTYAKEAAIFDLAVAEQEELPVCVKTALTKEAVFVESEEFWVENYMFDTFYNPEWIPSIEKRCRCGNEELCEIDKE